MRCRASSWRVSSVPGTRRARRPLRGAREPSHSIPPARPASYGRACAESAKSSHDCYTPGTIFTGSAKWACGPIFCDRGSFVADVRQKEKQLEREIGARVEASPDDIEGLAVEMQSPDRFTVYVDHPAGVDHALCARVTSVLRDYLREYTIDVSSPGTERPLRKPEHFTGAVGRPVQ